LNGEVTKFGLGYRPAVIGRFLTAESH
jgi:hypothetical protein